MPEVTVVGAFKANPGNALHRGTDDPARFTFIERWESRELLDAHLASDHVAAALERADELWGENGENHGLRGRARRGAGQGLARGARRKLMRFDHVRVLAQDLERACAFARQLTEQRP